MSLGVELVNVGELVDKQAVKAPQTSNCQQKYLDRSALPYRSIFSKREPLAWYFLHVHHGLFEAACL